MAVFMPKPSSNSTGKNYPEYCKSALAKGPGGATVFGGELHCQVEGRRKRGSGCLATGDRLVCMKLQGDGI
eukprot:scaffold53647_cov59-Attheya_sp.AAC.3